MSDNVPTEIWHKIFKYDVQRRTALSLRLVSRRFRDIFTPLSVQGMSILLEQQPRQSLGTVTFSLFQPAPEVFARHIKYLRISIEQYNLDPGHPALAIIWEGLARFHALNSLVIEGSSICLTAPDIQNENDQTMRLLDKIVDAVLQATDGRLARLDIVTSFRPELVDIPAMMEKITGLKTLILERGCGAGGEDVCGVSPALLPRLRRVIENNPSIDTLRITHSCTPSPLSLSDILPPRLTTMDLHVLRISGPILCPPDYELRQLPALPRLQYLYLGQEPGRPPVNVDFLWGFLRRSGVALKSLSTEHVSPALLQYLASFSGLLTCRLSLRHPVDAVSETAVQQALSAHSSSMDVLEMCTSSTRHLQVPAGCSAFTLSPQASFRFPISFSRLRDIQVHSAPDMELTLENCQLLAEFFSDFPSLTRVIIFWSKKCRARVAGNLPEILYTATGAPRQMRVYYDYNLCDMQRFNIAKRMESNVCSI